ncbi:MAG: hypothetical protein QOJ99_1522 [Bryobacterales bacterium]|jgi:hypothetical protein|nr:hypothetical protein [Bryobacterales bacterium]
MQTHRDFVLTQGADRFIQLNPATVHREVLGREQVRNVVRRDGTEELVGFAGLAGNREINRGEQFRQILRLARRFGFLTEMGLLLLLHNFLVGVGGRHGQPLRQQEIPRVTRRDFDYFTAGA